MKTHRSRKARRLARAAACVSVLCVLVLALAADGRPAREASPFRGREIFVEKRCDGCHSVWGHGGELGPDITAIVAGKTWFELVGAFWNHTPRMIDEVTSGGHDWPTLDTAEMADLLSYLYYLRFFDDPGDAERGAATWTRLNCDACHTLAGSGGGGGGALDEFGVHPSPALLAQAMWNAGPRMQAEQLRRGRPIPRFEGNEMADLQAHVRAEGLREGRDVELLPLPDPGRGQSVYRAKGCDACHGGRGPHGPDLASSALSRTVSEISGRLWNHSYAMSAEMAARGVRFPEFEGSELSDLIAYLYFLGYVGEDGDTKRGARIFREKGCAECHVAGQQGVPDLTAQAERFSDRAALAAAMWNHAPQMHELMAEASRAWPKFEPGEMRDLATYLREAVLAADRDP